MKNYIIYVGLIAFLTACSGHKGTTKGKTKMPFVPGPASSEPLGKDWFNFDPQQDNVEGVSSSRFYRDNRQASENLEEVIVAVIDSGVDVEHDDLKNKVWVNPGEIAGDGIDNDGNGYVDDIHGWNFLGSYNEQGEEVHVTVEALEMARIKRRLDAKVAAGGILTSEEVKLLADVEEALDESQSYSSNRKARFERDTESIRTSFAVLSHLTNLEFEELTASNVAEIEVQTLEETAAKESILKVFSENDYDSIFVFGRVIDYHANALKYYYNPNFDPRADIIGDDPDDFNDRDYGNSNVKGPTEEDGEHGTHVAGIIAAERGNGIGIDGIASNAKIMALRVVPDGDERDKDVALSIRYAADNGAKIINMSFGKDFSPDRLEVEKAVDYATSKGVILVHAAGNDAKDNDKALSFPARYRVDGSGEVDAWIEVGASKPEKGLDMVAPFSNYGLSAVDIFAPGYQVESTIPGNKTAAFSGTSMAAPVVSGTLALLMGLYPDLDTKEIRSLLLNGGSRYPGLKVNVPKEGPGVAVEAPFSHLSISGSIANVLSSMF